MSRNELIREIKQLVDSGEITDIESYIFSTRYSRTKAKSDLRLGDWAEIKIGKRNIYIKKYND